MAKSENQDDDLDLGWGDDDADGDSSAEESEHTVIDAELGALIRAAAEEKARLENESITTESALADLGPAFPGEESLSIENPELSTRVLEDPVTDQSIEPIGVGADDISIELDEEAGDALGEPSDVAIRASERADADYEAESDAEGFYDEGAERCPMCPKVGAVLLPCSCCKQLSCCAVPSDEGLICQDCSAVEAAERDTEGNEEDDAANE